MEFHNISLCKSGKIALSFENLGKFRLIQCQHPGWRIIFLSLKVERNVKVQPCLTCHIVVSLSIMKGDNRPRKWEALNWMAKNTDGGASVLVNCRPRPEIRTQRDLVRWIKHPILEVLHYLNGHVAIILDPGVTLLLLSLASLEMISRCDSFIDNDQPARRPFPSVFDILK